MKKLFCLLSILLIASCSDNLSNSKAKSIIKDCLKKNPKMEVVRLGYGKLDFGERDLEKDLLIKYKKLAENGYLVMDSIDFKKSRYYGDKVFYNIKLTDKSKEYVISQSEYSDTKYIAQVKAYEYQVDEVMEVHEVPSLNAAEVRVNYVKANITPFAILGDENEADFKVSKEAFRKTSEGWKFCDD